MGTISRKILKSSKIPECIKGKQINPQIKKIEEILTKLYNLKFQEDNITIINFPKRKTQNVI